MNTLICVGLGFVLLVLVVQLMVMYKRFVDTKTILFLVLSSPLAAIQVYLIVLVVRELEKYL